MEGGEYILVDFLERVLNRVHSFLGGSIVEVGKHIQLTSAEMAQLWAQYMNDRASICVLTFFFEKAEDKEIIPLINHSLQLSKSHIDKLTAIFQEEKIIVPHGFNVEEDVDTKAPRLYSDTYVLHFIHEMAKIGLTTYSASVAASVRSDITDYYMECVNETMELYKISKECLLTKGLYIRSPYIPNKEEIRFVSDQAFVLDGIGHKRPLIASEIANLFSNIQRNELGIATLIGFSQVAKEKEVKQFFLRGIEIAKKQVKLLGGKLEESDLPIPMTWSSEVTTSTDHFTFSDKLMMYFTSGLIALSIGYYGTGISQSPRIDLGVMYNRLSMEIQLYSEDGSNILIKNKWLEEPPMAANREDLIKNKKK